MTESTDRDPAAWPVLDASQLADMATFGTERATQAGELLFQAGEATSDMFVVLEGEIEVVRSDESDDAVVAEYGPGGFAGITEFFDLDKPVIVAANGLAFGGGFELALACDLIVAAEGAEVALPESGLGLVANAGGVQRLPRRVAPALAMELLLTGRRLGAEEALRHGLVNRVAPLGSLMSAAREYATTIAAKAPLATRAVKALTRAGEGRSVETMFAAMRAGHVAVYEAQRASEDAKEGPLAFAEKRPPVWTGR